MNSDLQKDKSIIKVLSQLYKRFEKSNLKIAEDWDGDLCASELKILKIVNFNYIFQPGIFPQTAILFKLKIQKRWEGEQLVS